MSRISHWHYGGFQIYPKDYYLKRIAFLGRGGHTLPTYRALLNRLAHHFDLTVYSEVPVDPMWLDLPHDYSLRAVTERRMHRRLREVLLLFVLIKDHLRNPYHLVHAHSTYPTGFAAVVFQKIFRVPAIVSLHAAEASAFPDIRFGDLRHKRRMVVNRWVIKHARTVTALTDFQRIEVVSNLKIVRPVIVIHRGVDLKRFYFNRRNQLRSPMVLLSVGYLNAIKDPETLLQAFELIQRKLNCVLIVVGQDYTDGEIKIVASRLGISEKVRFEGYVEHDRIDVYYREADILLHTSRYESQGMVVAEAMASGVVVVGTKVGLLSDLSGECCVTVSNKDPAALAEAVLSLVEDGERMEYLRHNAYRWSRLHSLDNCSEEVMGLYRTLTSGG